MLKTFAKFVLVVLILLIVAEFLKEKSKENKEHFKFQEQSGFPTFIKR